MKTQLASLCLASLGGIAALIAPTASHAANVGYYELCNGEGAAYQANAISAGGGTPVNITVPNAAQLTGINTLLVTNCDNGSYGAEWTANLADITARVQAGMTLAFYDRYVTGANAQLPGGSGIISVRDFNDDANIDIPAGSPLLNTNGGPATQTNLDNGNSSSHGYVTATSIPAGGAVWAHRTSAAEAVVIRYPLGSGQVIYSTIPGDYYLADDGTGDLPTAMTNVVQATIGLDFGATVSCASEGYKGAQLTWCKNICENGLTGQVLDTWIHRWILRYRDLPYCAVENQPQPE
jgi:hypothetical protein